MIIVGSTRSLPETTWFVSPTYYTGISSCINWYILGGPYEEISWERETRRSPRVLLYVFWHFYLFHALTAFSFGTRISDCKYKSYGRRWVWRGLVLSLKIFLVSLFLYSSPLVIWPCDVSYDPSKENEHEKAENFIQDDVCDPLNYIKMRIHRNRLMCIVFRI